MRTCDFHKTEVFFWCLSILISPLCCRRKAAVNMGAPWDWWACPLISPLAPSHLGPSLGLCPADHFSRLYSLLLFLSLYSSLFSYHFSIHSVLKYVLKTLSSYCHHSGFFFFLISHRVRRGRVWVLEPKSGLEPSLCWTRFLTLGKSQSIYASASLV